MYSASDDDKMAAVWNVYSRDADDGEMAAVWDVYSHDAEMMEKTQGF